MPNPLCGSLNLGPVGAGGVRRAEVELRGTGGEPCYEACQAQRRWWQPLPFTSERIEASCDSLNGRGVRKAVSVSTDWGFGFLAAGSDWQKVKPLDRRNANLVTALHSVSQWLYVIFCWSTPVAVYCSVNTFTQLSAWLVDERISARQVHGYCAYKMDISNVGVSRKRLHNMGTIY